MSTAAPAPELGVGLTTITPATLQQALKYELNARASVFVWGSPGIGKSDVVRQVASDLGYAWSDMRLSQMCPEDLRGVPRPVEVGFVEGLRWIAPHGLPRDLDIDVIKDIDACTQVIPFNNPFNAEPTIAVESLTEGLTAHLVGAFPPKNAKFKDRNGKTHPDRIAVELRDQDGKLRAGKVHITITGEVYAFLILEELNSADQNIMAAAYQLVLDRAIGDYEVPRNVFIIALGNNETDRSVTYKMPKALQNRLVHYDMVASHKDWFTYAVNAGWHSHVLGYLSKFEQSLFQFDPNSASKAFPTPRSWHAVSKYMQVNENVPSDVLKAAICGRIGQSEGIKFLNFHRIADRLPDAMDILSGKITKLDGETMETQLSFALTHNLCFKLRGIADEIIRRHAEPDGFLDDPDYTQWLLMADNMLLFLMSNFRAEVCVMAFRIAVSTHGLPFRVKRMQHFKTFTTRFRSAFNPSAAQ